MKTVKSSCRSNNKAWKLQYCIKHKQYMVGRKTEKWDKRKMTLRHVKLL